MIRHRYKREATWSTLTGSEQVLKFAQWAIEGSFVWSGIGIGQAWIAIAQLAEQVEQLTNQTADSFNLLNQQLQATSHMAMQNRLALDAMLIYQGGLCQFLNLSHDYCCVSIPNVSLPLDKQVEKMRNIAKNTNRIASLGQGWLSSIFNYFGWEGSSWLMYLLTPLITLLLPICAIGIGLSIICCFVQYFKNKLISLSAFVYTRLPLDDSSDNEYDDMNEL